MQVVHVSLQHRMLLEQEHQHTGIATACIGGGLGIALMIEKEYINMKV